MKLAVPDLISNSYFPAAAAVELGCFADEGLDVTLELIFPVDKAYAALRDGTVDFVGGSAHSALAAFPEWRGVKLLCAQAQGMYWFLVMHRDLGVARGDIAAVKGRSIGAAPWVELGLRRLLIEAGIDPARDRVSIAPVPGAQGAGVNFGLTAARALEDRKIDGFWANGMGAEVAVRRGVGQVDSELGCQAELGKFRGNPQPHAQDEVFRRLAVVPRSRLDDLVQLLQRIEAEGAHPVFEIGLANRVRGLDRVHEAQNRLGQDRAHQPHLGDRSDVEMGDAIVPQDANQVRRGIGLDRIERLARKLLDEETGGARSGVRAIEDNGLVRRESADYGRSAGIDVQLKGPPKRFAKTIKRQAALRLGSPLGAAEGVL